MSCLPKLAGITLVIFSWVAVWGLIDLLIHNWSKQRKFWFYAVILSSAAIGICANPDILEYF